MGKVLDLKGKVFYKLTVIGDRIMINGRSHFECLCVCGNTKIIIGKELTIGSRKSCGMCHKKRTREEKLMYHIWLKIKSRCLNPNDKMYKNYGGRGIGIHNDWMDFETFFNDMGKKPSSKHTVDRIDNNGNYGKSNCKWSDRHEQSNNRRNNIFYEYKAIKLSLQQWANYFGVSSTYLVKLVYEKGIEYAYYHFKEKNNGIFYDITIKKAHLKNRCFKNYYIKVTFINANEIKYFSSKSDASKYTNINIRCIRDLIKENRPHRKTMTLFEIITKQEYDKYNGI